MNSKQFTLLCYHAQRFGHSLAKAQLEKRCIQSTGRGTGCRFSFWASTFSLPVAHHSRDWANHNCKPLKVHRAKDHTYSVHVICRLKDIFLWDTTNNHNNSHKRSHILNWKAFKTHKKKKKTLPIVGVFSKTMAPFVALNVWVIVRY